MRMKLVGIAAVCIGALLGGCQTGVPQATNFANKQQLILKSVGQWQVLADWTIAQLGPSLPAARRINVQPENNSAFAQSFAEFLATDLVGRGFLVGQDESAPTLHFDVEVIEHGHKPPPQPLAFTVIGALGGMTTWILDTGEVQAAAAGNGLAFSAGPLIDVTRAYFPPPTDTEVAVTSALSESGQRYAGRSDVFYISRADKFEYQSPGGDQPSTLTSDFP